MTPPWTDDDIINDDDTEDNDDNDDMRYCGAPECNIMCAAKEYCANTGKPALCDSVKCISFDRSKRWINISVLHEISLLEMGSWKG